MMAIVQDVYGSPDVLQLRDVDEPAIGDDDVLIRVQAAGMHVGDWHVMTGLPYAIRFVGFGLRVPKVRVRGIDVAGKVEAVGRNVTRFHAGDDVFGTCEGAFAELARARATDLAARPARLSAEQAAAVPTSGFAALQALRDVGGIQPGQTVLIVGAAGGVGMSAVQIAKALGAEVTGVASTSKLDLVRSLGADRVIDYTQEDFTRDGRRHDLVLDTGGNRSLSDLRRAVAPRGTLVLVGGEGGDRWMGVMGRWVLALVLTPFVRQKLRPLTTKPCQQDLEVLQGLVEAGRLRPIIDRTYALKDVPDAFRYLKGGRACGKIVIRI